MRTTNVHSFAGNNFFLVLVQEHWFPWVFHVRFPVYQRTSYSFNKYICYCTVKDRGGKEKMGCCSSLTCISDPESLRWPVCIFKHTRRCVFKLWMSVHPFSILKSSFHVRKQLFVLRGWMDTSKLDSFRKRLSSLLSVGRTTVCI